MMSMTPDQLKKMGVGVIPSPSPFFTPRPERLRVDSRFSDVYKSFTREDKDREVNVQVILRCRPLSDDEQSSNPPRVVTCNELKREVTIAQVIANKQVDRVFTFDKVFGPKAQQKLIYDQAVAPVVREVLDGYNCTIFAYGQTGTGKTYTMEGSMRSKGAEVCAEAGVIPRAVRQIFNILEAQNADYSMKVSFLELYNEEITDLLTPEDKSRFPEDKQKKSVSLMEDGRGCVIIRGLEEEVVYSANDIYNLMERGAARRRAADTLLNKHSSRSHSVFTITVITIGEEELIKCGKLNLVDLAGSENIYGRVERIEQLEMELELSQKDVKKYQELYLSEQEEKFDIEVELQESKKNLESTHKGLHELEEKQKLALMQLQNKEFIISKLINSENSLIECAKELGCTLGSASIDIAALHKQIDDKNLLEAQNHELVLTFGSQLDKSLQNLHETILKSISQQQNQLICMEDHLCSYLAIKDDATKNLESTVQKIAEIHASTITAVEDFNSSLLSKTSADFKSINSSISSEVHEMEKLLNSLVIEAKDVIHQIQCSLSQQKELLVFSTQQQEHGLQRTLVSAQSINKATQLFFDEICAHASKVMSDLEECQTRNLNYLKKFEKTFEEQSALEEQQAMEKIVSAMTTLRANKTALVSQALRRINETGEQDTKACHQNLSKILQASVAAKNGLDGHVENIEGQYLTDLYLLTEINGSIKDQIKQCSNQVDSSTEQWKRAAQSVKKLHGESKLSIQSTINIYQNEIAQSQCMKTSSVKEAKFDASISSLLDKLKDTLTFDRETKEKMASLSNQCLDQLTSLKTEHNKSISTIRNNTSLIENYMVDDQAAPEQRVIEVPSLAAIERMKTPAIDDLITNMHVEERSEFFQVEAKIMQPLHHTADFANRAPFANIN